jgi:hypothetical protein
MVKIDREICILYKNIIMKKKFKTPYLVINNLGFSPNDLLLYNYFLDSDIGYGRNNRSYLVRFYEGF